MKDILPLPVTQGAASSDVSVSAANKSAVNTSQAATGNDFPVDSTADKSSFLDSLRGVLSSSITQDGASMQASSGGKELPLAGQTAESGPLTALPISTDMHAQHEPVSQQDSVLLVGVPQGTLSPSAPLSPAVQSSDPSAAGAALPGLSKLPTQPGLAPVDPSVDDVPLPVVDRTRVPDLQLTVQVEQAVRKADASISSTSPLLRMQLGAVDSSQDPNSITKHIAVKAGLIPQASTRDAVDLPLALKAGNVLNETDQLFTSRLQMSTLNQPTELAAQKLSVESMLTPTQAASTDPLNASLMRSSIAPSVLSTEALSTPVQSSITETFARADWGQGMGKQILWMVNQNISSAEFRLNPANLGPLEVRIDMDNDQVNVAFSSRHADVREAVEQALPKLREMFEEKGLNLSDADVSQHSFAEQRENAFEQDTEHQAGFASGIAFAGEGEQTFGENRQNMGSDGNNAMLNESLVDYYI